MNMHPFARESDMKDTIRVIQPGKRRVKIFIDFWNIVINARNQTSAALPIEVNWEALASQLVQETSGGYGDETTSTLAGCYIFGSYSRSDPTQQKMVEKLQDMYGPSPGIYFEFSERVSKQTSLQCDNCKQTIKQSSESGVDVLLCIEMIKHAAMREHEYLALVSSDRDFIPLLNFLKDRGERVIHASTGGKQRDMYGRSWKQIDLGGCYEQICTISSDDYMVLSAPNFADQNKKIEAILSQAGKSYKIYDITDPASLSDKDMKFIFRNQNIFLKIEGGQSNHSYNGIKFFGSAAAFRAGVKEGRILEGLPHISQHSKMKAVANQQHGWMLNGQSDDNQLWQRLREAKGS